MIVRGYRQLKEHYHRLQGGDAFVGRIPAGPLRHAMLIDLLQRGVQCCPSALSQDLNGSKSAQAVVFGPWMAPHTRVIRRRSDLLEAVNACNHAGIGAVVTKEDRMHCGHGVRCWENVEMLYNMVAFAPGTYPFVMQPYLEHFVDVRVIVAGDYREAYERSNPGSLRRNLSAGGRSRAYVLDEETERFCRSVMARGQFPYAHIDLHIVAADTRYLSEIALNGGIKGAQVDRPQLDRMKKAVLEDLLQTFET
jgi:glutathione synthase/RimK-type ligase-like ATP-grasp enzyme